MHVRVGAEEAGKEPGLALAAPFLLPDLADQIVGQIVGELLLRLVQDLDQRGIDAGLLLKLAQGAFARAPARIEAALRHLPGFETAIEPLPDPDLLRLVDQHDADRRAIAIFGKVDHLADASAIISFRISK